MNKPAPKEPSMDEILSSIRQIIADDDAAAAPRKPSAPAAAAPASPSPVPQPAPASPRPTTAGENEPLTLTRDQMVPEKAHEPPSPISFSDVLGDDNEALADHDDASDDPPHLVDPGDITFDSDDEAEAEAAFSVPMDEPEPEPVRPPPPPVRPAAPPSRPAASRAAPMPDRNLSSDMAERLLEPTTDATVKHAFARLSGLSMSGSGQTIETLLRDMLRPMLKDWLDENLPSIVERMVEKEITRVSRGSE